MNLVNRDELNRIVKEVTYNDFSETTKLYLYEGEKTEPSYISTEWKDFSHGINQLYEEVYGEINGMNLLVTERVTYYDESDNVIDFHKNEYFYDKDGQICMYEEQDNETFTTHVCGIAVTSQMGERLCSISYV